MEVRLEEEYIKHKKKETEPKEDQNKNIMIKTKLFKCKETFTVTF